MEFIGVVIGQLIGEFIFGFVFLFIYKIIIRPILMAFGCVNIFIKNLFSNDIKDLKSITYDELTTAGGDFIIGSLVISILLSIVFLFVYFGFYIFNN